MEPDEIMLKFKDSKIESNSTISSIFFVHLETLGLFLLYNQHLPFSFFLFLRIFLPFMCRKLFKSSILVNILWRIELQSNSITSFKKMEEALKETFSNGIPKKQTRNIVLCCFEQLIQILNIANISMQMWSRWTQS